MTTANNLEERNLEEVIRNIESHFVNFAIRLDNIEGFMRNILQQLAYDKSYALGKVTQWNTQMKGDLKNKE